MILPRWFILTVGLVALGLWVASFLATIFVPGYKADPTIGGAAAGIVSFCFASPAIMAVASRLVNKIHSEELKEKERQKAKDDSIPKP